MALWLGFLCQPGIFTGD